MKRLVTLFLCVLQTIHALFKWKTRLVSSPKNLVVPYNGHITQTAIAKIRFLSPRALIQVLGILRSITSRALWVYARQVNMSCHIPPLHVVWNHLPFGYGRTTWTRCNSMSISDSVHWSHVASFLNVTRKISAVTATAKWEDDEERNRHD